MKVERVKTMELISDQTNIKQKPHAQYKKITYVDQNSQREHDQKNVIQNIDYLMKISDSKNITASHQFTFILDDGHQVLYIQEPNTRDIIMKTMKEHECEICDNSDLQN